MRLHYRLNSKLAILLVAQMERVMKKVSKLLITALAVGSFVSGSALATQTGNLSHASRFNQPPPERNYRIQPFPYPPRQITPAPMPKYNTPIKPCAQTWRLNPNCR